MRVALTRTSAIGMAISFIAVLLIELLIDAVTLTVTRLSRTTTTTTRAVTKPVRVTVTTWRPTGSTRRVTPLLSVVGLGPADCAVQPVSIPIDS